MRFLDYSRSSIAETISHAYVAMDQDYIRKDEMAAIKEKANSIWKKINKLISYLKSVQKTNKTSRTNKTS